MIVGKTCGINLPMKFFIAFCGIKLKLVGLYHCNSPPCFLRINIPLDRIAANIASSRNEITSCPKAGHPFQFWKFVTKNMRRSSFYLLHNFGRRLLRPAFQKKMNMVNMALHRENFDFEFLAFLSS